MALSDVRLKNEGLLACGKLQHMRTFRFLAFGEGWLGLGVETHQLHLGQLIDREVGLALVGHDEDLFQIQPRIGLQFGDLGFVGW